MPKRMITTPGGVPGPLRAGVAALRQRLHIPQRFPADVVREAEQAAARGLPDVPDLTGVEFITIDPEGSLDLDQAMCIQRDGAGYLVQYAIADVAHWVTPGGPMDLEAHRRGQTCYAPDERSPLYPHALSEGCASLLADGRPRPAHVWRMRVDAAGAVTEATVARALVQNHRRMTYTEVQHLLDAGQGFETIVLLKEVGILREQQERARGGVSLPIPEQEVETAGDTWTLHYRAPLPAENWNAQISLMTGMAAATIMLNHQIGVLRTLPPVDPAQLAKLRRTAQALHIDWPRALGYAEFLRTLRSDVPRHMAMLQQCTTLFRGAGYYAFDGERPRDNVKHNALAAYYAHTTAPLRRLVDRYALEICSDLMAAAPPPDWVRAALPALPGEMNESDRRAKAYERGIVDLVESLVLAGRVGQTFTGTVVEQGGARHGQGDGRIMIADPAVEADVSGPTPLGAEIQARLVTADTTTGNVQFAALPAHRPGHDNRPH